VGCLDLERRDLHLWVSRHVFASPEGLAVLSDGTLLVAEETGRIARLDPRSDTMETVIEGLGGIESVLYDARKHRALVTSDGSGEVLALAAPAERASDLAALPVAFDVTSRAIRIPTECPPYLAGVLRLAGFDPARGAHPVSFATLASRLSMLAIDAKATLIASDIPVADPIEHVQLAVFTPRLMGFDMSTFIGPVGGFAARSASGVMVTTTSMPVRVLRADVLAGTVTVLDRDTIPVPYPGGARLSAAGIASVHLLGFGRTPDYSVVIDALEPRNSYLLAVDTDGRTQQYRLELPAGAAASHWVVALRQASPETWTRLTGAATLLAQVDAK
jgi:hypothetical protein